MSDIVKFSLVEQSIVTVQGQQVLIDSDVAVLYGVTTKEINQAVKNNPNKFPQSYLLPLNKSDKAGLVKNFDRFERLKHSTVLPTAFTERGLYMLATILKGDRATATTIAIVETFAKMRELSRTVAELSNTGDDFAQKSLMQKSGDIIADLLDSDQHVTDSETSIELNLAVLKFRHTVKRKADK